MAAVVPFDTRSDQLAGERLGERIAELNAYLTVAQAHFLELLREFDEKGYCEALGFRPCAHWLNFKCGLGFNAARERLRVAHALAGLPKIDAAFAEGRVSFSKVRAMTRVATPDNEDLLLNIARHGTAYHVERFVRQYRQVEKLSKPGAAQDLHDSRELQFHFDEDGCLVIRAKLPAEQGELVIRALERAMDCVTENATGKVTAETPGNREPVAIRRADALCEMAESYLNHPDNAGSTADRYQVVVHVRADIAPTGETPVAQLENDPCVSAVTSERIACDCSITTIEESASGEPLNIGRRSRTIPAPMRRALIARDSGCCFPGCTSHRFCDGHHVVHWQDGGETRLENLVLLCRYHHRLVHEGGFDCPKVRKRRNLLCGSAAAAACGIRTADAEVRRRDARLDVPPLRQATAGQRRPYGAMVCRRHDEVGSCDVRGVSGATRAAASRLLADGRWIWGRMAADVVPGVHIGRILTMI